MVYIYIYIFKEVLLKTMATRALTSFFCRVSILQPDNIKKHARNIEDQEKKLANARVAIVFNKTCLNENLLPTFTNIYIYIYI